MTVLHSNQDGFSAVELLITLFIGAIFVMAGYQLYTYVYRSGTEASQMADASMVAYKYLRSAQDTAQGKTCTAGTTTPIDKQTISGTSLGKATVTITTTCRTVISTPSTQVSLIQATVTYDSGSTQGVKVSHAGYAY